MFEDIREYHSQRYGQQLYYSENLGGWNDMAMPFNPPAPGHIDICDQYHCEEVGSLKVGAVQDKTNGRRKFALAY